LYFNLLRKDEQMSQVIEKLQSEGRHAPLMLRAWHEVVRNNEVPVSNNSRQTWD